MIPEIIEQMRKELYDTKLCISDFEKYDLKTLEKTNEPFFWLVRTHGTHLCFIGPSVESLFSSESNRFAIMKDSLAIIASIVYWDDLDYNKYFYWDGAQLQKVSKDKIVSIFNNIWGSRIHQLSIQYPEEYAAIGIAGFDREDYISTDEDGKEEFDEDLVCYDFSNWWDNMDDIEQVKEYRKHE